MDEDDELDALIYDTGDLAVRIERAVTTIEDLDNNLNNLREAYYNVDYAAERLKNALKFLIRRREGHVLPEHRNNMLGTPPRVNVPTAGPSPGRYVPMPPGLTPRRVSPTYNANVTTIVPTPVAVQPGRVVFPTIPRLNSPTRMGIVVDPVQPLVRQPTVPQPLSPTVTNIIGETVKVVKAASPPRVKIPTVPQPTRAIVPTIQVPRVPIPQIPTARVPQVPRL